MRVLTGLSWAGRAVMEQRRDQSLVLYTIALEALLAREKDRPGGVTSRFRHDVAHVVGRSFEARKALFAVLGDLYRLRSKIVHAGDSDTIANSDLETLRNVATRALTAMLTESTFTNMGSAQEFDRWLDERLLVGDRAKP